MSKRWRILSPVVRSGRVDRLSAEDWQRAAVEAIAEGGVAAVSVEPLARKLGVTKGSFYAHFGNRAELVQRALDYWVEEHVGGELTVLAEVVDPAQRLRRIVDTAFRFAHRDAPSAQISLLGELWDERVRAAVTRVNSARTDLIAATYRELGLGAHEAQRRAQLVYSTYLGALQLSRSDPDHRVAGAALDALIEDALRLYLPY